MSSTITPRVVSENFAPARLTQARALAGLLRQDVSGHLGVSPAAISQYEAGQSTPHPDRITPLADILGVPIGFLAHGRPLAHLDVLDVHFDSARTPIRARFKATAAIEQTWELVNALAQHVHLPYVDLPGFAGGEMQPPSGSPASVARALRAAWGISGPLGHLTRQIEARGVIIAQPSTDPDVAALGAHSAVKLPRPIIVPTTAMVGDVYQWRWGLARQLGHLLLHGDEPNGVGGHMREADQFAGELLLPADDMATSDMARGRLSTRRMLDMCRTWGVPADALTHRREQLGMVSASGSSTARSIAAQLAEAIPSPISDYPGEVPTLTSRVFSAPGLSVRSLAAELAWTTDRVYQLLGERDRRPVLRLVVDDDTEVTA